MMSQDALTSVQSRSGLEFWLRVGRHPETTIAFFVEDSDCRVDHRGGNDFVGPFHLTDAFGVHRQVFIRLGAMDAVRTRLEALLPQSESSSVVAPSSEEDEAAWADAMLGGSPANGEGSEPALPGRSDSISLPPYHREDDEGAG